jgi:hypothetical protein
MGVMRRKFNPPDSQIYFSRMCGNRGRLNFIAFPLNPGQLLLSPSPPLHSRGRPLKCVSLPKTLCRFIKKYKTTNRGHRNDTRGGGRRQCVFKSNLYNCNPERKILSVNPFNIARINNKTGAKTNIYIVEDDGDR